MGKCKYASVWETNDKYKDWILPDNTSNSRAKCSVCNKSFDIRNMGKAAFVSHMPGKKCETLTEVCLKPAPKVTDFFGSSRKSEARDLYSLTFKMRLNEKALVTYANCSNLTDKEGFLLKRGEVNKGFQKRWFTLKGNLLFYYDKRGDKEPLGVIVLEGCTIELDDLSDAFTFLIKFYGTTSRTYVLSADTHDTMEAWMKALSSSGYEYMRLLLSDLQQKLDELNTQSHMSLVQSGELASKNVSRSGASHQVLGDDNSSLGKSSIDKKLISFDDDFVSTGSSLSDSSQASTPSGRINPFNVYPASPTNAPDWHSSGINTNKAAHDNKHLDSFPYCNTSVSPANTGQPVIKGEMFFMNRRSSFAEMHELFGQLILDNIAKFQEQKQS